MKRSRHNWITGEDRGLFLKLHGHSTEHCKNEYIAPVLEAAFAEAGAPLISHLGPRGATPIKGGVLAYLAGERYNTSEFAIRDGAVTVRRTPEKLVRGLDRWADSITLHVSFRTTWAYSDAALLFETLAHRLHIFWGELNFLRVTKTPSGCEMDTHYSQVPHFGYCNYLGPEYVAYFGGMERLAAAGFDVCRPSGAGAIVSLERSRDEEEYRRRREEVRNALGIKLCEPRKYGLPDVDQVLWKRDVAKDNAAADVFWGAIQNVGELQKRAKESDEQ